MDNAEQEHDRQRVEEEHRRKGAREKSGSQLHNYTGGAGAGLRVDVFDRGLYYDIQDSISHGRMFLVPNPCHEAESHLAEDKNTGYTSVKRRTQ